VVVNKNGINYEICNNLSRWYFNILKHLTCKSKHVNLKLYLPIFGALSLGTNCGFPFAINST
jgi:hypothetical protein